MTYRNLKLYMFVFVLAAITCGGCRSSKDLGDSLNPEILPGDIGLNQRFEDGIRVPASEFNVAPISFAYDSFRIKPSDMATIARKLNIPFPWSPPTENYILSTERAVK